eukprot:scaffold78106_cov36-Phaeocystis_antarctica.AAC.1
MSSPSRSGMGAEEWLARTKGSCACMYLVRVGVGVGVRVRVRVRVRDRVRADLGLMWYMHAHGPNS